MTPNTSALTATTIYRQSPPISLSAGFDCGNGSTNLVFGESEILIPSYLLPIHNEIYDPLIGLVEYIGGARSDLINKRWLSGISAYQQNPMGYYRVVDDRRGKLNYGLQLLLGAIATLSYQPHWTFTLVASIQDAQAFGNELSSLLNGSHTVRFNGKELSRIEIRIVAVVEEGVGAIVTARSEIESDGQTLLYDFGTGTCIISIFGAKGKLLTRKVTPGGVENLIDAIARNLETRKQLNAEGDRQIIRAGIEAKTFEYGTTGWNFRHIYQVELKPWVQSTLATALKAGEPWRATSRAVLAVGGGSELPQITQLLTAKGITPIFEGHWANARGLAKLAQLNQRRGN
jgi:hypothetical protein